MTRKRYYLNKEIVRKIGELNVHIEVSGCRQLRLLKIDEFARFSRNNQTSTFDKDHIAKLWQIGYIQADIVRTSTPITIDGLVCRHSAETLFLYTDERTIQSLPEDFWTVLGKLRAPSEEVTLLFHPFRCYVLNYIKQIVTLTVPESRFIEDADKTEEIEALVSKKRKWLNNWLISPETIRLFKYWNDLISLCVISEPSAHRAIYHRVGQHNSFESHEAILEKLHNLQPEVNSLFQIIGEEAIESYRQEICEQAERIDPNKNLHLIIRLMNANKRERLEGSISAAMLFLSMAETLRWNLERTFNKEYPEEDELGFGEVFPDAKIEFQGSTRVLDGNRIAANQFLRRFGLDYGIRANIYVEGDTEFEILSQEFSGNSSILVINLKGAFVEKHGKGVYFRESLRNDIKAKTFSLIVLDSDVSDNYRAVKQAALNDEICGKFFVSTPDFEIKNFSLAELSEVIWQIAQDNDIQDVTLNDIQQATKNVKSGKGLFKAVRAISLDLLNVAKGKMWGQYLLQHARNHPLGKEFGDKNDRLISQIIRLGHRCCSFSYETTRQGFRVDPETGDLIKRT